MAEQNIDDLELAVKIQVAINNPEILTKPMAEGDMQINTNTENLNMIGVLLGAGFESIITAFHNSLLTANPISQIDMREENLDVDISFVLGDKE